MTGRMQQPDPLITDRDLVTAVQLLYDQKNLLMSAHMAGAGALIRELSEMRVHLSKSGNESFSAWREGAHDDLVFALALAVWGARRTPISPWGKVRLI